VARKKTPRTRKTPVLAIVAAVLGTALAVLGGVYLWGFVNDVRVSQVAVSGHVHALESELIDLSGIDSTGSLMAVKPDTIEARVSAHPWIDEASVRRWPTGRVDIRVRERVPVLLAIDARGEPSVYVDAHGHVMPLVKSAVYDVPLLRADMQRFAAQGVIRDGAIRDLASALARLPREVTALLSDAEYRDGEIWMRTLPAGDVGTLQVRLGRQGLESRLMRLHDFWHQAVLPRPDRRYSVVDLRFDSQIVTRETVISR
jgi:cell division septal protein FtsQ